MGSKKATTKKTKTKTKKENAISKLSVMREKFKNEYILSGHITNSAIKAGYSKKTAYSQGQRLLKNVEIKEAILKEYQKAGYQVQKALSINNQILESDIKNYLTVVEGGAIEFIPFNKIEAGLTSNIKKLKNKRVIKEVTEPNSKTEEFLITDTIEIELYDKQKAIANILDISGIKIERVEHSGDVGNTLIISNDFIPEIKENDNT